MQAMCFLFIWTSIQQGVHSQLSGGNRAEILTLEGQGGKLFHTLPMDTPPPDSLYLANYYLGSCFHLGRFLLQTFLQSIAGPLCWGFINSCKAGGSL